jgi:hypothetical protein
MKSFRVPVFALKSPTIAECIFAWIKESEKELAKTQVS